MLGNARAVATLPVVDLARARRFYEGKLGLKLLKANTAAQFQDAIYEAGGGTRVYLYQRALTIAVATGFHTAGELAACQPDYLFKSLRDYRKVIKAIGGNGNK